MELRKYQIEARDALLRGAEKFQKQVCVLPCGGGKTITFASLIRERLPGRALVLAHRESLVEQAVDKIWDTIKMKAGVEMASSRAGQNDAVVVSSIQSLQNRLDRWSPDHFKTIIVDECHHVLAESWLKVLNHFDSHGSVFGWTATPSRGDRRSIGNYFQNFTYEIGMRDLIDQGYLCPIVLKALPVQIDMSNVSSVAGDFHQGQTHQTLIPLLRNIAQQIKQHAEGRKTLVFLPLVETSQMFADICNEVGLNANWVSGSRQDRDLVMKQFKKCDSGLLANALLVSEGVDIPSIDALVVLRPTRSVSFYQQMCGRGTRIHDGKENLLILDFLYQHERHPLARPANLFTESQEVADIMTNHAAEAEGEEINLIDLEQEAAEQQRSAAEERHIALEDAINANRRRKARTIDPTALSLAFGNMRAAEYEPTVAWHSEPVSEKQIQLLRRQQIDVESVRDKGHAHSLIGMIMPRYAKKLATPKQVMFLRKHGYPSPERATFDQAGAFIGRKVGR
jgi:superfamily II DNA or RNA helicase